MTHQYSQQRTAGLQKGEDPAPPGLETADLRIAEPADWPAHCCRVDTRLHVGKQRCLHCEDVACMTRPLVSPYLQSMQGIHAAVCVCVCVSVRVRCTVLKTKKAAAVRRRHAAEAALAADAGQLVTQIFAARFEI
jgi:hypothetical protein